MESVITFDNVSFCYNAKPVLTNISLEIYKGEILGLLGPNGSGKSTLLKLIDGILLPKKGTIFIKGQPITKYKRREIAKHIAMVGQEDHFRFPFTVAEVVLMGRFPYMKRLHFESNLDLKIAYNSMIMTHTLHLANRSIYEISGGERQRVFLARAIAQQPSIILLDEITSFLDIKFKKQIFELLLALKNKGIALVIASHDIELMARYCDRIVLLKNGSLFVQGNPYEVITEENISIVYECQVSIDKEPNNIKINIV